MEKYATLEELIDSYGLNDAEKKSYDKLCKEQNALLKTVLKEQSDGTLKAEGTRYKVSLSVTEKLDIDETKLINVLKKNDYHHLIKTVEVVDEEALEKAMYNDEIDGLTMGEIANLQTKKQVETLRVSLIKKGKKDDD